MCRSYSANILARAGPAGIPGPSAIAGLSAKLVPNTSPGSSGDNCAFSKCRRHGSSLSQTRISPPTCAAASVPRARHAPSACRIPESSPGRPTRLKTPSSSRSSSDTDGGTSRRVGSPPSRATARRATFNSARSSISASHSPRTAAGVGIRRAFLGSGSIRPGCAIYATDSS